MRWWSSRPARGRPGRPRGAGGLAGHPAGGCAGHRFPTVYTVNAGHIRPACIRRADPPTLRPRRGIVAFALFFHGGTTDGPGGPAAGDWRPGRHRDVPIPIASPRGSQGRPRRIPSADGPIARRPDGESLRRTAWPESRAEAPSCDPRPEVEEKIPRVALRASGGPRARWATPCSCAT
jgi:hypothetical protein